MVARLDTLLVVGLVDNVGLLLAEDGLKVVKPDGGEMDEIGNDANVLCRFLVSVSALTCIKQFNLYQKYTFSCCHVNPDVPPTCKGCEVHQNFYCLLFRNIT